jgi:ribosome biogenesis GTPase
LNYSLFSIRKINHQSEPNCAIKQALEEGTLDAERYQNYRKLQRELAYLAAKED